MPPTVEAERLGFRYPDGSVGLHDLTLDVRPGEVLGLLGPNGSGKSTLLRLVSAGDRPGLRLRGPAREARGRWLGDERPVLRDWLSGRENATLLLELRSRPPDEADRAARASLLHFGLEAEMERPAGAYSTGMRRRTSLAIAFADGPDLLLLDEPLSGLDPTGQERLAEALAERSSAGGTTVLSTHAPEFAARHCDRVAFLVEGAARALDAPARLVEEAGFGPRIEVRCGPGGAPDAGEPAPPTVVSVQRDATGVVLRVTDVRTALPQALSWLLDAGARIESVEVREPTLRDAFFRMTGVRLDDRTS